MRGKFVNLVGRRFGRLVVKERSPERRFTAGGSPYLTWNCLCDCGNFSEVDTASLTRGSSQSCGCLRVEQLQWKRQRSFQLRRAKRLSSVELLFRYYQRCAKGRDLVWELSLEKFSALVLADCSYCGLPAKESKSRSGCNGIDRKDNTQGYLESNSVPCCQMCNRAKSNLEEGEFVGYLLRAGRFQSQNAYRNP